MLPIVALIAIAVTNFFIVIAMKKKNQGQDIGDPKTGRQKNPDRSLKI